MSAIDDGLPRTHGYPVVGRNLRNGLPVSRDPLTGELWTLYPEGKATLTAASLVRLDAGAPYLATEPD